METYPIRIYGRETGKLQVSREGMYTVFRATSECSGEVIRLCVFGGGKSGYLGVMVPDGSGTATLTRRLSKSAMCDFPEIIEYAGVEAPGENACTPCPEDCCPLPPVTPEPEPPECVCPEPEPPCEPVEPLPEPVPEPSCPDNCPHSPGQEEEDILWYSCPDGTLTTFDGKRTLVAFPAEDVRTPRGAEGTLRVIDGKQYIIFAK